MAERRALELLPNLDPPAWEWRHAPESRFRTLTQFSLSGPPTVYIRDDLSADHVFRTGVLEPQHCHDEALITTYLIGRDEAEARAVAFAAHAARAHGPLGPGQPPLPDRRLVAPDRPYARC